jgi:hypothetical protein
VWNMGKTSGFYPSSSSDSMRWLTIELLREKSN